MKKLRYSPAAAPGRQRPVSRNTLQRRYQQASAAATSLAVAAATAERKLRFAQNEAHNASQRLRQMFRASAQRIEFDQRVVRACINIDVGIPYRDPGEVLSAAVVELINKIVDTAPELHIGPTKDLLTWVRHAPENKRQYLLYPLYHRSVRAADHMGNHISFHDFCHILNVAADNIHLLEQESRQDALWTGAR